jgi:hypothetical protein
MDYRGIYTVQSNTTRQPLPPEVLAAAIFAGFDETRGGSGKSRLASFADHEGQPNNHNEP